MRVESIALQLRPRPMAEAADLGVLLVQRHARSLARTWGPVFAFVALLAFASIELGGWVPSLVVFWCKPWLDRTILFVLSRAVFGEETRFADLWRERRSVWWSDLPHVFTLQRLSPWRSYTQAIGQLEGQRGGARRKRREQLLRGKRNAAGGMHLVYAHVEIVLVMGVIALAFWFAPAGTRGHLFDWFGSTDSLANELSMWGLYATIVLVLEPFYVASGFAMYLNRRVELEAWDLEQEFRRALA